MPLNMIECITIISALYLLLLAVLVDTNHIILRIVVNYIPIPLAILLALPIASKYLV